MTDNAKPSDWWRSAAIYQIYPRSFADSNGDGLGDLPGITKRLPQLGNLFLDAIWLSPFFTSPQKDAGYDVADYCNVDPRFGTLDDFDDLLAESHRLGMRVLIDLVPNHTSDQHAWFQAAIAAGPGSEERTHYLFRDGKGAYGDIPPNNWLSVFGGSAWERLTAPDGTPEQWYLHLFDVSQPDLDWTSEWVREQFREILRFWLRRGVDGFRVDVAHGLVKKKGLPDFTPPATTSGNATDEYPYWAQPGVHEIYQDWHRVLGEFDQDRVLCAEAWVEPLSNLANWVRSDEMQQAFNFTFLEAPWSAPAIRTAITSSMAAFEKVGAVATWVLSNHDVIRHASRLGLNPPPPQGEGIGPKTKPKPDAVLGLRRARAETLMMLALPGGAYLYQGEELGLPEDVELPDSARQDPSFFRHHGTIYGRDGCRVPIPWEADAPAFGFSSSGKSWLPIPADWTRFARDQQPPPQEAGEFATNTHTLSLYSRALELRRVNQFGLGTLTWLDGYGDDTIAFSLEAVRRITVISNLGSTPIPLPAGKPLVYSERPWLAEPLAELAPNTTIWMTSATED
ncbi:MAG TPA: glycoside hydrolase family 13 protein [Galbitalea sp.]|nr:glycoside hydrolase family 13 protein [Galbitalea sp.]